METDVINAVQDSNLKWRFILSRQSSFKPKLTSSMWSPIPSDLIWNASSLHPKSLDFLILQSFFSQKWIYTHFPYINYWYAIYDPVNFVAFIVLIFCISWESAIFLNSAGSSESPPKLVTIRVINDLHCIIWIRSSYYFYYFTLIRSFLPWYWITYFRSHQVNNDHGNAWEIRQAA